MLTRSLIATLTLALFTTCGYAQDFALSGANTKIGFVGAKKDGKHTGNFKELKGTAAMKGGDPTTLAVSVVIDVDSIETDNAKLTAHLKAPDFFEVKRFPEAKFVSTEVKKGDKGYVVTGDLTMHGKTSKVSFPADIAVDDGLKLKASFNIDRNDWGISYGKGMINDEVAITLQIAAEAK
jgi:polyisoprenoid-binding protein YceI